MIGDDLRRINLVSERLKLQENGHELNFDFIIIQIMIKIRILRSGRFYTIYTKGK